MRARRSAASKITGETQDLTGVGCPVGAAGAAMPGAASGPVRTTIWPARSPTAAPRPPLGATPRCARRMRSRSALRAAPDSRRYGSPVALRTWRGPPSRWSTPARQPRLATQSSAASGHPGLANALHPSDLMPRPPWQAVVEPGTPGRPKPLRPGSSYRRYKCVSSTFGVPLGSAGNRHRVGDQRSAGGTGAGVMGSQAGPRTAGARSTRPHGCTSASSSCSRGERATASRVGRGLGQPVPAPRRRPPFGRPGR